MPVATAWTAEAEGLQVPGQPELHSMSGNILDYMSQTNKTIRKKKTPTLVSHRLQVLRYQLQLTL